MTTDSHKFRYLIPPGSNFQFIARSRVFLVVAALIVLGSIGALFVNKAVRGSYMNWTIDFKGGTEVIYSFKDKADPTRYVKVDPQPVRAALKAADEAGFDVSDMSWTVEDASGADVTVHGIMIRTPRFSALEPEQAEQVAEVFRTKLAAHDIEKAAWSGERLYVRSRKSLVGVDVSEVFTPAGLELLPWGKEENDLYGHPDEGTAEYRAVYAVRGIDAQLEKAMELALPAVDAQTVQSYAVGAKAGAQLRGDAIKSIVYAMFLIILYLAFRFDLRYAPGAAFATLHDAIAVVGVFAVTWSEVSLTTVAAVLTVIGFSVNDTVVIFDRIRENQAKLRDKRLDRIVDISLNETLVRSILTSLTVFSVTLIMNIFGDGLVRNFAFAMNVGVIFGTFSSIFVAAPIFLWVSRTFYSGPPRQRSYVASAIQAEE